MHNIHQNISSIYAFLSKNLGIHISYETAQAQNPEILSHFDSNRYENADYFLKVFEIHSLKRQASVVFANYFLFCISIKYIFFKSEMYFSKFENIRSVLKFKIYSLSSKLQEILNITITCRIKIDPKPSHQIFCVFCFS